MSRAMGRYELLRPLARGGMAEVYLARRRAAGVEKLLVLKRIRAERATDARFLELFVREARLSMSLAHQNIVPVFDFGRAGDEVFLAMERVEGKDLGSSLARPGAGALPAVVAAFIAAECCRALAYAHARRVVHRDVTPRNVLLSWSGEVKLTDFGIAALAGEDSARLVGTPAYMAPEQARGEAVDARADLYALGLVLREAATGVRARGGADRDALLDAAKRAVLDPWPDGCPPALVAIVDRATQPNRDDRFPDARAMLAALDELILAERTARTGPSPDDQLAGWLARAWDGAAEDSAHDLSSDALEVESMFDDAAIGTGTERSLAATAADGEVEPPPEPPGPVAPRRRVPWALPVLGLAAVGGIVALVLARGGDRDDMPARVPDAAVVAAVADAKVEAPIDAAVAIVSEAIDAADIPAPDAAVADATRRRPPRDAAVVVARVDAAPVVKRKVRINARPWATFTVDGGATQYETISTVELAPGPHKLRFTNPELGVVREVVIDVPRDRDIDHVEDLRR
jgi:tRNA A-37 threonylcarbamoyl transferase component Bud32